IFPWNPDNVHYERCLGANKPKPTIEINISSTKEISSTSKSIESLSASHHDESASHQDGSTTYDDGSTTYDVGSASHHDGSSTYDDGSTTYDVESTTYHDGSTTYDNGSTTNQNEPTTNQNGIHYNEANSFESQLMLIHSNINMLEQMAMAESPESLFYINFVRQQVDLIPKPIHKSIHDILQVPKRYERVGIRKRRELIAVMS
ncbi:unnamed protein product, partial [Diamesa tonsa]